MGQADGVPCALKRSRETHGITSVTRLRGGGGNEERNGGDDRGRAGKRSWQGVDGAWGRPHGKAQRVDDQPRGWGRPTQQQEPDVIQNPQLPPSGWGQQTQHQEQEGPRNPQAPPLPPRLQQIMQQKPCTSQGGHRLLADCPHRWPHRRGLNSRTDKILDFLFRRGLRPPRTPPISQLRTESHTKVQLPVRG